MGNCRGKILKPDASPLDKIKNKKDAMLSAAVITLYFFQGICKGETNPFLMWIVSYSMSGISKLFLKGPESKLVFIDHIASGTNSSWLFRTTL